jgi:hypothetical protein
MRSQMRVAAALRSLNFRIGWTPGRLLQIESSRLAGQDLASSANSYWLLKLSKGVVIVAAASSGVACAVMWLSVSIVKVVIFVVLCSARFAVNTWITPHGWKGKAILSQNDAWRTDGDGGPRGHCTGRVNQWPIFRDLLGDASKR